MLGARLCGGSIPFVPSAVGATMNDADAACNTTTLAAIANAIRQNVPLMAPSVNSNNALYLPTPDFPSVLNHNANGVPVGAEASIAPNDGEISAARPTPNMMTCETNSGKYFMAVSRRFVPTKTG